jgi:5-methyltetrahydropteroyltriglutamate--homocysteine methyltransferase
MKRSVDRILTTHVGSIIRPESLLALVSQKAGDAQAYAAALRDAVEDVIRRQVAVGIDIVNDGGQTTFSSASRDSRYGRGNPIPGTGSVASESASRSSSKQSSGNT